MTQPDAAAPGAAFGERLSGMAMAGYGIRSCPPHCLEDADHAHVTSPDGWDFIAFADGTVLPFDLTRNSGIIAPVMTPRRRA